MLNSTDGLKYQNEQKVVVGAFTNIADSSCVQFLQLHLFKLSLLSHLYLTWLENLYFHHCLSFHVFIIKNVFLSFLVDDLILEKTDSLDTSQTFTII